MKVSLLKENHHRQQGKIFPGSSGRSTSFPVSAPVCQLWPGLIGQTAGLGYFGAESRGLLAPLQRQLMALFPP